MFGRLFRRQQPGKAIEARTMNRPIEAIEQLDKIHVAAPLELVRIAGVPLIRLNMPATAMIFKTPGGGIAARVGTVPGSAACNIQWFDGTNLIDSGIAETVYNQFATAFGASKYIQAKRIYSRWFADTEDC